MGRREVRVEGRSFVFEWGKIGSQAGGAVLARENDTVVLVAAIAAPEEKSGVDFFPLTVEYRERLSAAGRFPGGYRKREGPASTHEILTSRLIDRSIRPLFPEAFKSETQVLATVLSCDPDGDPAILGILGACAALSLSDIPWNGPVAALRLSRDEEGEWMVNPTSQGREGASVDLTLSFGRDGLVMAEGGAAEQTEEDLLAGLARASDAAAPLLGLFSDLRSEGKAKRPVEKVELDPEIRAAVAEGAEQEILSAASTAEKTVRRERLAAAREKILADLADRFGGRETELAAAFEEEVYRVFRESVIATGRRADGRKPEEIRPIACEAGWLPRVHGSSLFTRGETQAMVVCTLGTGADEQEVEGLGKTEREFFQLYYRFPPYSVGEVRPLRGPGRREIGHGALARRSLVAVLPGREAFPYTIKIESEITASNGSSSMASVCGGCLALMDAGVPITRPVAGIAMGLIRVGASTVILSDILGDEDHLGDMDFKVAGTERGITALQLDNKIGALPLGLLKEALEQARRGRMHILAEMARCLPRPRPHLSPLAPRIRVIRIAPHRIRSLIGPGGKMIQAVQAESGCRIDVADDGTVRIFAGPGASIDDAARRVRDLTGEPEIGKIYRGRVAAVKDFGIFVRLFEGIEGLVHVSELAEGRVDEPARLASPGDEMVVRVLGADGQGKIRLSRRQALKIQESEIEGPN